ncbi:hypothetical protein [Maricaulis sp.]|uniref:hypothetical protein n=1 Tax=Maricaulis sp. TaxID=1486257 RepID=UPI00261A69B1|nr:hypothetical protein [Maricaulis sp.]
MTHAVIDRFKALDAAFQARAGRGEKLQARFAALAALSAQQDVESLIEGVFEVRGELNQRLGHWRAPDKPMRLVYATVLATSQKRASQFFVLRKALQDERARRGGRGLSHGAAPAALALCSAGADPHQADTFFDALEAIAAPWWRREAGREEVLAAAGIALGLLPDELADKLDQARQALRDGGIPNSAVEAAAYEVALLDLKGGEIASAWTSLNLAVRGRSSLRSGVGRAGLAVLAAHGNGQETAEALVRSFDALVPLKPRLPQQTTAKLAMRLTLAQLGDGSSMRAASELAAILAAQAAMIAAVTSGAVVATAAS